MNQNDNPHQDIKSQFKHDMSRVIKDQQNHITNNQTPANSDQQQQVGITKTFQNPGMKKYFADEIHGKQLMKQAKQKIQNLESFKNYQKLQNKKGKQNIEQEQIIIPIIQLNQCFFESDAFKKAEQCFLQESNKKYQWFNKYKNCRVQLDNLFFQCWEDKILSDIDLQFTQKCKQIQKN